MNPFLFVPSERMAHWKTFRRSLTNLQPCEQSTAICRYFAQAPLRNIAYDIDHPATWPTMWEMVHRNDWCRNSVAIGMAGTLALAGCPQDRIDLRYVVSQDSSIAALVVIMDAERVLNYEHGVAVAKPAGLRTVIRYRWDGRGYARE